MLHVQASPEKETKEMVTSEWSFQPVLYLRAGHLTQEQGLEAHAYKVLPLFWNVMYSDVDYQKKKGLNVGGYVLFPRLLFIFIERAECKLFARIGTPGFK